MADLVALVSYSGGDGPERFSLAAQCDHFPDRLLLCLMRDELAVVATSEPEGKPPCNATLRQNRQRTASRKTEPMDSAERSAVQTIGAREDRERITRIRNRRCYGGADRRHLDHAGARRRRRQAGQGKERKRRPDARHNGGSHWENNVKHQHGFDPQSFN
jgi:hypothetical protein